MLAAGDEPHLARSEARAPVIVVVFDELPSTWLKDPRGHGNGRRYPNFARLAGDSTWFPNATTVHNYTDLAVPAILSGRRSEAGTPASTAHHPDTLFLSPAAATA